jgi:predicted nucleic acid binding AN1-type Zn finger protein
MYRDYLNFHCSLCNKNLCKEHYHNEVNCPFYKNEIKINTIENNFKEEIKLVNCHLCKKSMYSTLGNPCKSCKFIFCVTHRLENDHQCQANIKLSNKEKYINNKNLFKEKLAELKKKK